MLIIFTVLVMVGYPLIFETATRGRSVGKIVMGLRVVSDDGGPERFRQALFRALASVIEIWMFLGSPAVISSILSPKAKRIGDIFAGTIVVSERAPRLGPPPMMPPHAGVVGVVAAAIRPSAGQADVARQFLSRAPQLDPSYASRWHTASPVTWCTGSPRRPRPALRRSWCLPPSWPNDTVGS